MVPVYACVISRRRCRRHYTLYTHTYVWLCRIKRGAVSYACGASRLVVITVAVIMHHFDVLIFFCVRRCRASRACVYDGNGRMPSLSWHSVRARIHNNCVPISTVPCVLICCKVATAATAVVTVAARKIIKEMPARQHACANRRQRGQTAQRTQLYI